MLFSKVQWRKMEMLLENYLKHKVASAQNMALKRTGGKRDLTFEDANANS